MLPPQMLFKSQDRTVYIYEEPLYVVVDGETIRIKFKNGESLSLPKNMYQEGDDFTTGEISGRRLIE